MSQVGRTLKNLETPRPLKSSSNRQVSTQHAPVYELQTSKLILLKPLIIHFESVIKNNNLFATRIS